MTKVFPQNFDLRLFSGPRAKQFANAQDAFQQLLGDALTAMAGPYAHISPTRGRDGSIDAFLLDDAPLTGPFQNLHLPLIVECKTHDDTVKGIDKNILSQWALMKKKLEANAQTGWKDLFEPWLNARGYAYCISAQLHSERLRTQLTESIQEFFAGLPADQRVPIDSIRVIDWNNLRQWLGASPLISDSWLGIELELIFDHASYLSRLSGFREYLLPSKLEFVSPPSTYPFHPARVLDELENLDTKHGVVLVGAGGVGKTRTAIEVATLAASAGWRVLHILPDEPGVETEQIAEVVLPYSDSRTLLVFDYIDQMQRLDISGIRRSLAPAAKERGIQFRLLANSRPGWKGLVDPEFLEAFSIIEIRPTDSHKATLIEAMATRIAPKACAALGKSEVIHLCGTRAIIALLIARELETRAENDLLKEVDIATLRSGDLVQWLRRRLQENALSVKRDTFSLSPLRPEAPMVAAAAALACAPETRANLIVAAASAYRTLNWPTAAEDAQYLVELLLKLGWLEAHGNVVSTAHDVVADEVLDQTIHTDSTVFSNQFSAVMSCALKVERGIGRLATALRRVLGSLSNEDVIQALTEFAESWLYANGSLLGEVLRTGNADLTGYALGAVLSGPPWERAAIREWDNLVLPWLQAHGAKKEARHLLFKGLKGDHAHQASLVDPALTWLGANGLSLSATFVIQPLLERSELSEGASNKVIESALSWLQQHDRTPEAQFVLHPFLERSELSETDIRKVIESALGWLQQYEKTPDAGFVLPALLQRGELSEADIKKVIESALGWLQRYKDGLNARFVLQPLLERSELSEADITKLIESALGWLQQHDTTLEAGFVLPPLLERSELSEPDIKKLIESALGWLQQYDKTAEAQFVLHPLLERSELSETDIRKVIESTLGWLQQYDATPEARFVLPPLLERSELSEADLKRVIESALGWLKQYSANLDAAFVLSPLLDRSGTQGEEALCLVKTAVEWLQTFYETTDAEFVLKRIFRRGDVPVAAQSDLMSSAIRRLRERLADDEATFLLRSCLQYRFDDDALKLELISLAIEWLELHPGNVNGEYVWNRVLRYRRNLVNDMDWLKVAKHAMLWLKNKNLSDGGFDQTTNSLLMRPHLLESTDQDYVIARAIALLGTNLHKQGRRRMVGHLEWLSSTFSDSDPLKIQIDEALKRS